MWLSFFVDFIVFAVLECCREFFNKIYSKFHGPRHVRGLVFRFRTHHPGTLSSTSYDFPVSHLETETDAFRLNSLSPFHQFRLILIVIYCFTIFYFPVKNVEIV